LGNLCQQTITTISLPIGKFRAGLGVEVDRFPNSSFQIFFTQPVFAWALYTNYKNVFLNVLGGANFHLNSRRNTRFNVLGGESELFLFGQLVILLSGGPRYFLLKNDYGNFGYFLNIGIRVGF